MGYNDYDKNSEGIMNAIRKKEWNRNIEILGVAKICFTYKT